MLIGMILLGAAGCGKGGEEEGSVNTSDITGAVDGNGEENKENPDDVTPEPTKVGIPPVPTLTPEPTKASEPASDGESSIEDTRTKEEIYNDMIARSFLSAGNNYRVTPIRLNNPANFMSKEISIKELLTNKPLPHILNNIKNF